MVEVLFHREAQAEYDAAFHWYIERNPTAATRFETDVERILDLIAIKPEALPCV